MGRLESRIWPGRSGVGPLDQLVAGGQHADPGRREHLDPGESQAGQHPEVARREDRGRLEDGLAGPQVVARGPDVVAHGGRHLDDHGVTRPLGRWAIDRGRGALHHDHRVGARRQGRPGHDADGLPGTDGEPGRVGPRGQGGHHAEPHRSPGGVGRPHREAVHGRVGKGGDVDPGHHRLGEHQSEGLGQGDVAGGQGGAGGEDPGPGVLEGDHVTGASCAAPARPGNGGSRDRGRRGRWRSRRWPGGSRACRRCRSGRPRTGSRTPSAPGAAARRRR